MHRTKIVATIGPASRDPDTLARMVEAGLDVARLNFSHGDRDLHAENADRVRAASATVGRPVAILQDLPGPKLRIASSSSPASASSSSVAPALPGTASACRSPGRGWRSAWIPTT
jgi:pyruvate kinase